MPVYYVYSFITFIRDFKIRITFKTNRDCDRAVNIWDE